MMRRAQKIIKPRIGCLWQYEPRLVVLNKKKRQQANFSYPLISIITPSYGQGEFIERTILSILNQDYPNLEYYIQDGGSKDGTVDVLKRHEKSLAGWESRKDNGQSHAINLGFSKTSGEIMGWLNSDDLMLPNALNLIAAYFDQHPDIDVVYGNRLIINADDMDIGVWILPGHNSEILSWVDYVPQETLFWRRRLWDKIGSHIDESFKFAMDWDLLVRFRDAGGKFGHLPNLISAFRIHDGQKTSALISTTGYQEMDRIRHLIHGLIPSKEEIRKAVSLYLINHLIIDFVYRIRMRFFRFHK